MDNLAHLIAAYFYQSWDEHEYSTWQEAVDDFAKRSPSRVEAVSAEIASLLRSVGDDHELAAALAGWGLDHTPPEGERAWLMAVGRRLTKL